jgi:hypothetical protein
VSTTPCETQTNLPPFSKNDKINRCLKQLPSFQNIYDITNFRETRGDTSGHRRCSPQRFMDANEIVVHREQRGDPARRTCRTWRDGWRTLKFLPMYSPRWLYLVPGIVFLTFGTLLALALLFGPVKLANVVLDLNTLLVACALAIVGVQLLTFGVLSRYYAIGAGFLPS